MSCDDYARHYADYYQGDAVTRWRDLSARDKADNVVALWAAAGSGSVARQVMGTTVIGGMLGASLIAVFLIPVSFVLIESIGKQRRKKA